MVREIRSHSELDAVPIMLLTAKADDTTKYNLLQGGVQEYLSKPFKAEVSHATVGYIIIRNSGVARGFILLLKRLRLQY